MRVGELAAFLATQPQEAIVLIASERECFGDTRVQLRGGQFTYAEAPAWNLHREVIHEDDQEMHTDAKLIPAVTIGKPL